MTEQTIGLRIADRRKLLGISQEALGEKMGVSRQAISKWEADAAIPEIDKLIAMSKLFGVTVGWLLGTESDAPSDTFSDSQLQLVEELVKKYSPQSPPKAPQHPIWLILLIALVAIAMVLAGNAAARAGELQSQLSMQTGMLYTRYNDISDQLCQLEKGLEDVAASDRLLTQFDLEVRPMEDTTDLALLLTAVPGTWAQGDRAWLSLRQGAQEALRGECTFDGTALTARFTVPMASSYDPYLIILRADGTQQQQVLRKTVLADLGTYAGFQLDWECAQIGCSSREAELLGIQLQLRPPQIVPETACWEMAQLQLCVNGEVRRSYGLLPLQVDAGALFQVIQQSGMHYVATCDRFDLSVAELELETGDVVTLVLQGNLTSGHSFHQTLWIFHKTETMLECE